MFADVHSQVDEDNGVIGLSIGGDHLSVRHF